MFLIFVLLTSIITVIGRIRIIARRRVGGVISLMLTTLFLLRALLFFALESNDDESDKSDDDGSGFGLLPRSYVSLYIKISDD